MEQGERGIDLFRRVMEGRKRVGFDTNTLIYFLEGSSRYDSYARHALKGVESGRLSAAVSVVVELELLVKPLRLDCERVAQDIVDFISGFPNLDVVPVTRSIDQTAAQIRARSRVGVSDAIVVSTIEMPVQL